MAMLWLAVLEVAVLGVVVLGVAVLGSTVLGEAVPGLVRILVLGVADGWRCFRWRCLVC